MQTKLREKNQARALRIQGQSLRSISRRLNVSKSSVSLWCKDISLTPKRIEELKSRLDAPKLGALANKLKRQREVQAIRQKARGEVENLILEDHNRLKDIGLALYWAEGGKKNAVDFTNSDPQMIKIAMAWFRQICHVPETRFRLSIYYHSGQNEDEMKIYWSKITGVPLDQFHKSIFKKEGSGQRKNILYNGTCKIRICDKNLLHRIITWIEQLYINK